jgi:hypothetical protein
MEGRVTVDGKLACEAIVMCQLVPRRSPASPVPPPEPASDPGTPE